MIKTAPPGSRGAGLILGLGARIPYVWQPENLPFKKKKSHKQKHYGNKFNKNFIHQKIK